VRRKAKDLEAVIKGGKARSRFNTSARKRSVKKSLCRRSNHIDKEDQELKDLQEGDKADHRNRRLYSAVAVKLKGEVKKVGGGE
jgi:hypothetical protein